MVLVRDSPLVTLIGSATVIPLLVSAASIPINWGHSVFSRSLQPRDLPDFEDLSWVRAWATLGDSYAAGIGAGNRVDRSCSRYDKSYPYFISNDERLGTNQYGRSWQNVACSGATAVDVTKKQIPAITGQQNFITLSAGGNDVGLVSILNDCIFQWKLVSADRCAKTIQETQDKINNDLPDILDQLLHDAKEKLDSVNARIFYTGYAQFFNADSTQCDSVTFKFWSGASGTYLTRELRRTLNDLVVQTNNQIKAATERAGDQVVFVDIDTYFQLYGGRFCDDGALEPAPIRYALLFYERNTRDPTYDFKRRQVDDSADIVANDTFEGEVANWIEDTLEEHPDWKSNLLNGEFEEFNSTNPPPEAQSLAVELLSVSNVASWWVPDTTKRVFHPRPNGHAVIANLVLYHFTWEYANGLMNGVPTSEELVIDTCPLHCPNPSACPTCSDYSVPYIPAQLKDPSHDTPPFDPNGLIIQLRQDLPMGLQSRYQNDDKTNCEIAVALPNNVEAWVYRGTPSTSDQWQDCWDAFMNITNWCIREGPNNGWVNGPNPYEYYQAGFRPINDKTALHPPLDPTYTLLDTNPPPPDTSGWTCKNKCPPSGTDTFTVNWCVVNCKCSVTGGGLVVSCPES